MGKMEKYLMMKTDMSDSDLIGSDLNEIGSATRKLANHLFQLVGSLGFGTIFLQYFASFAGIYLIILDRTNWRTKMLTALLVPYIFMSLPNFLFALLSGEVGKWIAFVSTILRLFFPQHFPDFAEIPSSLGLLLVVAPEFILHTIRESIISVIICLSISGYLLRQHIKASGSFRDSFAKANGISNTLGLVLMLVYPIWAIIAFFF
ncbi:hypothetical protein LUZ60_010431 [Juncus effusus]|nr:hypothetical protein LUZ60_010431 [Juncus effusus]